jgi:hypothetical protein
MISDSKVISMSIMLAILAGLLSLSCGSRDAAQDADASHGSPPATPVATVERNDSVEPLPEALHAPPLRVHAVRLVDSVRWYEENYEGIVDSGFHYRVELVTSDGVDTIPAVFTVDQPVIRADSTEVVGLTHDWGRRNGFFSYKPGDVIPELHSQLGPENRVIIDPKLSPDGDYLGYSVSDKNYHLWAEVRSWPGLELLMATERFETEGCDLVLEGVSWASSDSIAVSIYPCGGIIRVGGSVTTGLFAVDSAR